tara:strand:+ start:267 stop:380 length:114 start_codon:yes stop_codon:yes gene_type:complete
MFKYKFNVSVNFFKAYIILISQKFFKKKEKIEEWVIV